MASPDIATQQAALIRTEILRFLAERIQPKLDKLKDDDDETRQKLIDEHQPATWIASAARRVGWIQQVSHALKFTHPSADGSNLSSSGNPDAELLELGTHSLRDEWTPDVVGNAAALDVYKFLCLTIDGRSLLERSIARDPALAKAFSDDEDEAAEWMAAFAALPEPKGGLSSHKLAKQLYWPMDDGAYHLLAPLFSSALAHVVYKRINNDRFSDDAKAAQKAWNAREWHPSIYRTYPKLAIQSFGGSKPQNISQLNSERRGQNYLLASVPPIWESTAIRLPLKTDSVFTTKGYFGYRRRVSQLIEALRDFLKRAADANNVRIRNTRHQLVADLCDQVLQMAAELREAEPGWTATEACQLNLAEQCWLDPERSLMDETFAVHYRQDDWKQEICLRFANWLNAGLQTDKTFFGADEAAEWKGMLEQELKMLREDLDDE